MIGLLTKITAFFLKLLGRLDADGNTVIDFFEMLIEPGMPAMAEKVGCFSWYFLLILIVAVIVLVVVMVKIRRLEVGPAVAILITVGLGYHAGHGVMIIAFIISLLRALIIWLDQASLKRR